MIGHIRKSSDTHTHLLIEPPDMMNWELWTCVVLHDMIPLVPRDQLKVFSSLHIFSQDVVIRALIILAAKHC